MLRALLLIAGLTLPVAGGATPAEAAPNGLSDDEMAEIVDFVVGNAVFALYHQAGHMMIERYGLDPAGGERAADRFAVLTLLEPRSGAGDQTLVDAVDSWQISGARADAEAAAALPDRHSIDGARANAIICDMVGADPAGFADIADANGLSATARSRCGASFAKERAATAAALAPIARKPGAAVVPLTVAYDTADPDDGAAATMLKDNHVLEEVADRLAETYALPSPPTLKARSCGEVTSLYDAARNELVLCYELSGYHAELILDDIGRRH